MPLEAKDIKALATALQGLRPESATVNATAVKLPLFWSSNPEVWFKQVESIFSTRKPAITNQQTKFDYVIQALDNSTADRVQAVILSPPEEPYDTLKAVLIEVFGKTQAQKDQEVLNINGLGDKKPLELLQHIHNDPATLPRALFLAQLPPEVRQILATSEKTDIKDLAREVDRIMEVSKHSNDSQVNASGELRGRRNPVSKSDQQWALLPGLCKYHSKFGDQARSCLQPCKFHNVSGTGNCPQFRSREDDTPFWSRENATPFRSRETAPLVDSKQLVSRSQQCTSPCFRLKF